MNRYEPVEKSPGMWEWNYGTTWRWANKKLGPVTTDGEFIPITSIGTLLEAVAYSEGWNAGRFEAERVRKARTRMQ